MNNSKSRLKPVEVLIAKPAAMNDYRDKPIASLKVSQALLFPLFAKFFPQS